mmetsp:Transcript_29749/g.65401  ORF Transcript_29749/g.65401 Transcript_29749/m.65401 type:complete len:99 (+) Transcript_29749:3523-3819(+)
MHRWFFCSIWFGRTVCAAPWGTSLQSLQATATFSIRAFGYSVPRSIPSVPAECARKSAADCLGSIGSADHAGCMPICEETGKELETGRDSLVNSASFW